MPLALSTSTNESGGVEEPLTFESEPSVVRCEEYDSKSDAPLAFDSGQRVSRRPADAFCTLQGLAAAGVKVVAISEKNERQTAAGLVSGSPATPRHAGEFRNMLSEELCYYPVALFERMELEEVVICAALKMNGVARSATVDFDSRSVFYDAQWVSDFPGYSRRLIHHELFHLIDHLDDGELYTDCEWEMLNDTKFKYQRVPPYRGNGEIINSAGFSTEYSKSSVEEDEAEVFSIMMTQPKLLNGRIHDDAILRHKVDAMRRLLGRFCDHVCGPFWLEVEELR